MIRLEVVTAHEAREANRAQGGFAAENADKLLGFADYSGSAADPDAWEAAAEEAASSVDMATAEEVTGRPAHTFADQARDHVDDFRRAEPEPS
ncbi:hypothetical protein [Actinoalloteichus sp. GBA129-24]|uniref:hypothetical protein n=1 Tax=Actinoalloteichus sp. GBA129-24 TaxID=1612551 RepID=UPI0009503E3E|nr:hypothetical protein [Actinoalloteichus sp. GBA129-24]APU18305.1 hypothetical protein UA75_01315 [Actinoalloteichus sp. GBA129-24]